MYCKTWTYHHVGWRKFAAGIFVWFPIIRFERGIWYPFRKHLKTEKERIFYQVEGKVICSYENYAFLMKENQWE